MIRNLLLFTTALLTSTAIAVAQQGMVTITLDAANAPSTAGTACEASLNGETVYIHMGCSPTAGTYWMYVIGNWGADDGVGQMTDNGDGTFSITVDLDTYFADVGYDPVASGPIVNLSFVFRNADGSIELKALDCVSDVKVDNVDGPDPLNAVALNDDSDISWVTVSRVSTGIAATDGRAIGLTHFPNPFVENVRFDYQLDRSGEVRIDVFDATGRLVAAVSDGFQPAGAHQVDWDASGLPAGPYTYRMTWNGRTAAGSLLKH